MKKHILERYRRDDGGKLVIDIAASKVSDLYDDFDKHAPFVKKELDYDLVEYLIDSVRELGREPFSVMFTFAEEITPPLESRVRKSIHNYFGYLLETNRRELMRMFRSSAILLGLGAAMLSVSIYLNLNYNLDDAVIEGVMAEGLVIAAWVSVWEGLAAAHELASPASHKAHLRTAIKRNLCVWLQSGKPTLTRFSIRLLDQYS